MDGQIRGNSGAVARGGEAAASEGRFQSRSLIPVIQARQDAGERGELGRRRGVLQTAVAQDRARIPPAYRSGMGVRRSRRNDYAVRLRTDGHACGGQLLSEEADDCRQPRRGERVRTVRYERKCVGMVPGRAARRLQRLGIRRLMDKRGKPTVPQAAWRLLGTYRTQAVPLRLAFPGRAGRSQLALWLPRRNI